MLNSFLLSFKLKNTYRVNTIIYSIKQLPILNKHLTINLYSNPVFKVLGNIISILYEIFTCFFGKFLYLFLMVFLASSLIDEGNSNVFINIITFLTIVGGIMNTYMFNPTNDKYYAMILMKMDAKKYTLSNYIYMMLKTFIGFLPFSILFGLLSNVNFIVTLTIPLYVVSIKTIFNFYNLYRYNKSGKIIDENHPQKILWIMVVIFIILAYGLPFINIFITKEIFLIITIISFIAAILSLKYIFKFNKYYEINHEILNEKSLNEIKLDTKSMEKDGILNIIDDKHKYTSNKKGYAYFNDLFIKRHDKILMRFAKKVSLIAAVITIVMVILIFMVDEIKIELNKNLVLILPTLTFIMYYINSGQRIAQVLFMNCDSAMLTYGFYKEPKVILSLFKERLKSVVLINLLPSIVISLCYVLLLYLSGGSNFINYILVISSINAMSLFFSVHNLVLYYLLQPYNINSDIKSMAYQIVNSGTYFCCYFLLDLELPITIFASVMVIFSIVYIIVSLILVYHFAPKTFKIHL